MIGETVTRIRPGEPTGALDRYNKSVVGPDVESPITRCAFAPAGSTEPTATDRFAVITLDTVYRRGVIDVTSADRLRVRGLVREVEGRPEAWVNPNTGRTIGTAIRLKMVEG